MTVDYKTYRKINFTIWYIDNKVFVSSLIDIFYVLHNCVISVYFYFLPSNSYVFWGLSRPILPIFVLFMVFFFIQSSLILCIWPIQFSFFNECFYLGPYCVYLGISFPKISVLIWYRVLPLLLSFSLFIFIDFSSTMVPQYLILLFQRFPATNDIVLVFRIWFYCSSFLDLFLFLCL